MTDNIAVDRIYCGDLTDLQHPVAPIIRSEGNFLQTGDLSLVQIHRDTVFSFVEIMLLLRQLSYVLKTTESFGKKCPL